MDILDFCARVLVMRARRAGDAKAMLNPDTVLSVYSCDRGPLLRAACCQARVVPVVGTRSALGGHAAASTFGHVWQAADRLASTRARRAAAARDVRFAGTPSPVPKI